MLDNRNVDEYALKDIIVNNHKIVVEIFENYNTNG